MSQTVIITGATSGIGLHYTEVLAKQGYKIIAVGRTLDNLNAMISRNNFSTEQVEPMVLDVQSYESWQAVIAHATKKWDKLDILINNAGIAEPKYVHELTQDMIDRMVDTNVKGTMYGTHLVAPIMVKQKSGHIINIGSLGGVFPLPGSSVYAGTKFALRGFSYSIAYELRQHNVYVSCIMPDSVDTPQHRAEAEHDAAVLSFQSAQELSVVDMEKALHKVLKKKSVELCVPRFQGWLAKLGMTLTGVTWATMGMVISGAKKNQEKYRAKLKTSE